jgi:cytochrome c553
MGNQVRAERSNLPWGIALALAVTALLTTDPTTSLAGDFDEARARVDHALHYNPARVPKQALVSCQSRRNFAVELYRTGHTARAERKLAFCFDLLGISRQPEQSPAPTKVANAPRSMKKVQAQAAREVEKALVLAPDTAKGLEIYRTCAMCHMPEGCGLANGSVPQLAGQHRGVAIKQLSDTRAGSRENFLMLPYASAERIGGAQAVADVAAYIDTLEISVGNGKGPGDDPALGERLYQENCASCHGPVAEGKDDAFIPRIRAQHYNYLARQFQRIRDEERHNANPEMIALIQKFHESETRAILDYVSRIEPPEELQAPAGWRNPDFAD